MTFRRTLLAAAVSAAALAPAPAVAVESRAAVDVQTIERMVCQLIVDVTHIERSCDEGHGRTGT